ncbi:DeoR family transcriptional regulator [Escherichia coli]
MYRDTRREYIVRLLRNKDECSVSDLANYFSVTKETIRTDLAWLQKRGVVSRHHGGVSLKKHLMQNALSQQEYVDMSLLIKQQQQGIGYLTSLDDKGRRMVGKVCVLGSFNVDIVAKVGNDSNLLIVFYVQIMPDDLVMQLHRF